MTSTIWLMGLDFEDLDDLAEGLDDDDDDIDPSFIDDII